MALLPYKAINDLPSALVLHDYPHHCCVCAAIVMPLLCVCCYECPLDDCCKSVDESKSKCVIGVKVWMKVGV